VVGRGPRGAGPAGHEQTAGGLACYLSSAGRRFGKPRPRAKAAHSLFRKPVPNSQSGGDFFFFFFFAKPKSLLRRPKAKTILVREWPGWGEPIPGSC